MGSAGAFTGGTKLVKVCGITNPDDALVACRAHASLIGVIFAPKSKRCVTAEQARSRAGRGRRGCSEPASQPREMVPADGDDSDSEDSSNGSEAGYEEVD